MNTSSQKVEMHQGRVAKLLGQLIVGCAAFLVLANINEGRAQTADDYVVQGRGYLASTNLSAANAAFANALSIQPSHPVANVLYAVTRLLTLPSQPAGSNFLSRLGVSASGRDIYNWTASIPTDAQRVPIAPAGVNADETTDYLAATVLPELLGADANLAQVTDTNFTVTLTSEETRSTEVTLDYGDLQMLRAMVRAAEYGCYATHSWNIDAQLTAIRALYTNNTFSVEQLFQQYPELLTFANTNDLSSASACFQQAVASYTAASDFIHARPIGTPRLFNVDGARIKEEAHFRQILIDLTNSMSGAVPLTADNRYSVFLPAQFDGQHSPRSLLPAFYSNGFILGSLPDASFGGLLQGLTTGEIEASLARYLRPIPAFEKSLGTINGDVEFSLNTLRGHGYVIQSSTDLVHWTDEKTFVSFDSISSFADSTAQDGAQHFFRAVDKTSAMPPPPNDNFADRISLTGSSVLVEGYNLGATLENDEEVWGGATVWWSWTAPFTGTVELTLAGSTFSGFASVYTGNSLATLAQVGWDSVPLDVVSGTTYQIQVGAYDNGGGIRLAISQPPAVFSSLTSDLVFLYPTNLTISAFSGDYDGTITNLSLYADGKVLASTTNSSLNFNWSIVEPGSYDVYVVATDNLGVKSYTDSVNVTLRPPNDNFANATVITSTPASVTGTTGGATKEDGEPNHGDDAGGSSVWWSWTAPSDLLVSLDCTMTGLTPLVGVYVGDSVDNLTAVASAHGDEWSGYATVGFTAQAGTTYYIAVDSEDAFAGDITLNVTTVEAAGVTDVFGFAAQQSITGLMLASNGMFYGTTAAGGTNGYGTVFQMTSAGVVTTLASFDSSTGIPSSGPLLEGAAGYFYGVAQRDQSGQGTVFKITSGGQLSVLAVFAGYNGSGPEGALVQDAQGNLYGTTYAGGSHNFGTVFKITLDGAISVITSFDNTHGAGPTTGVTFGADGNLYGLVSEVGSSYNGGIFRVSTNGSYSLLKQFNVSTDGGSPNRELVTASGGVLLGATTVSGPTGSGTIFKVQTNGTVSIISTIGSVSGLTPLSNGSFYGATKTGGAFGLGYIFNFNLSGATLQVSPIDGVNAAQSPNALVQQNDVNIYGFGDNAVIFRATAGRNPTRLASLNETIGSVPRGNVVVGTDGAVYGTTSDGGANGYGTVYKEQNGVVTTVASFDLQNGAYPQGLSQDVSGRIYGTCGGGGALGWGTVFRLDGATVTTLASFDGTNGMSPAGQLAITADGTVYGTTYSGGIYSAGNVFAISSAGIITNLYSFDGVIGATPQGLVQGPDGNFYGSTYYGDDIGDGIIFRITPTGVMTVLHSFNGEDGAQPNALIVGSDSVLYGTAAFGGDSFEGTVFKITTSGFFTKLADFTDSNGAYPYATLVEGSPGMFYGTTSSGGANELGTLFQITTGGTLTTRLIFDGSNGSSPDNTLTSDHVGNLYTTMYGPLGQSGDLFKLTP